MRLLNAKGVPLGIYFRKHKQNKGYVIRVIGGANQTDIGVTPDTLEQSYERAIDRRLEMLGVPDDAEAWQTLASAYGAFLTHYGVEVKEVKHLEFDIKGETK